LNILDENTRADQREMLRSWRISVRQIGFDTERKGVKDENILLFLLAIRRPTFLTRDQGFYRRALCHARYCLVVLAIHEREVAEYTRRVLRHPAFNTQAKRMGTVIRASTTGLTVWRLHARQEEVVSWTR
jgi:uncharacterized protein with PIN domain